MISWSILYLFTLYTGFFTLMPSQPIVQPQQFIMQDEQTTAIANYLWELNPDPIMAASFYQESQFDPEAVGLIWEKGICQLRGKYNPIVYDSRWKDRKFQVERCVAKWKSVPRKTKWIIWASYWSKAYLKYIPMFSFIKTRAWGQKVRA